MALTSLETRLVRLFIAAVVGDGPRLAAVYAEAEPAERDAGWREALLQVHLFAGFPRMIDAFEVIFRAGEAGGPSWAEAAAGAHDEALSGDALFDRIYADAAPVVRDRLTALHPALAQWVREHAYGRVLSRPGLTPRMRELLAVAALAVMGPDRQLASHARGAVRCGASADEVFEVVRVVEDLIDDARRIDVQTVIRRFATGATP